MACGRHFISWIVIFSLVGALSGEAASKRKARRRSPPPPQACQSELIKANCAPPTRSRLRLGIGIGTVALVLAGGTAWLCLPRLTPKPGQAITAEFSSALD